MSKGLVAILGAGNGGHAAAADLTARGFEVRLYEDKLFAPRMEPLFKNREITYQGVLGEGKVTVSMVTTDMAEALDGVEYIFTAVPANGHLYYAKALIPHLRDGQVVLVNAGNFGSLVFWKQMKEYGVKRKVLFAETYTMAYDARLKGPGDVEILGTRKALMTGVLPAKYTAEVIPRLQHFYPEIVSARSVLDCGLYTLNPVVHVPGCIMNCGRIELMKGEFWFYKEGITPSVGRVTEALDAERMSIISKLGYQPISIVEAMSAPGSTGGNIYEIITSNAEWGKIKGPEGFGNRYFKEDIPYGLVPWAHLAKALGVATPIMDSLINIGCWVLEENCWETGRTMKDIDLDGLTLDQIKEYVEHGWCLN